MFEGFEDERVDVGHSRTLVLRRGRARPRLLRRPAAGAGPSHGRDREHEETDRSAGRKVGCPTLFLWSSRDDMESLYGDPLAVWEPWTTELTGSPIDSGHHMAEENPAAVTAALRAFLVPSA